MTMLSRVADHLYWMSRYLERAEHTARMIDVFHNLVLEQEPSVATRYWDSLLISLEWDQTYTEMEAQGWETYQLSHLLTFDADNSSSIYSCIRAARDNARNVRELISSEMWNEINRLYLGVTDSLRDEGIGAHPHDFYQTVKEGAQLFQGITDSTTYRGPGWNFIQLGRYIERARSLAVLLEAHFKHGKEDYLELVALLKCCTAFEAFCKVYSPELQRTRIVQFLLLNSEFPHSVRFAVDRIDRALNRIAENAPGADNVRLLRLTGRLASSLRFGTLEEMLARGVVGFLEEIRGQLADIHEAMYQAYITYPIEQALVPVSSGEFW